MPRKKRVRVTPAKLARIYEWEAQRKAVGTQAHAKKTAAPLSQYRAIRNWRIAKRKVGGLKAIAAELQLSESTVLSVLRNLRRKTARLHQFKDSHDRTKAP
jgi:DNA-binding NarL/FixJ family response regulator